MQRVVIDCLASLRTPQIRETLAESDLLVVPLPPSIIDEHATRPFLSNRPASPLLLRWSCE